MNSHEAMIFLVLGVLLAAAAAGVFLAMGSELRPNPDADDRAQVQLVNAIGQNISDGSAKHIRISISSEGAVRLNDTLITISQEDGEATLAYRNGTLERNETTGFYTQ